MSDYISFDSLLTLGGAAAAIGLVASVVAYLAPSLAPRLKWLILILALGLAVLRAYVQTPTDWQAYVVALFNGAILFLVSAGVNTTVSTLVERRAVQARGLSARSARWL
jgi:hypothetical protein